MRTQMQYRCYVYLYVIMKYVSKHKHSMTNTGTVACCECVHCYSYHHCTQISGGNWQVA